MVKRLLLSLIMLMASSSVFAEEMTLLNVSYDPTREFYDAYNPNFVQYWKEKTGQDVKILQSHGGSGKQARSVIDGLKADVVTLALGYDIDEIASRTTLIPAEWQKKFPHASCPYTSAIVLLVRKGNPKNIKDWKDLTRPDVQVVTPNPKTSGGARWNYLAAWGYAIRITNNNEDLAKDFMKRIFLQTSVLDSGARGSTTNFVKRGIGDVLITWENEALLISRELEKDKFEMIMPSVTMLAQPPVAVVEANAAKKGTTALAEAYLEHLYSKDAQGLLARFYYRPSDEEEAGKHTDLFLSANFLNINDLGGWKEVNAKHFAEGGMFDQIYSK